MWRLSAAVKTALIGLCMIAFSGGLWSQFKPSMPTESENGFLTNRVPGTASVGAPRQLAKKKEVKSSAPIQSFETPGAIPDENYVLTLTILRVALILYIGPCVTFYGNDLTKAASFFQAGTAAGFWGWWNSLTQIAYIGDLPPVFENLARVLFTTGTTGLTMMIAEGVRMAVRAMLLAYTFVMQIVPLIEMELVKWSGCQKELHLPAVAIRGQSYDAWVGCTEKDNYYASIWIIKCIEWLVIISGAIVAMKMQWVKDILSVASAAMVGADMIAAGIEALITDIMILTSSPAEVANALATFAGIRAVLCYGLSGYGFICQLQMAEWWAGGYDRSAIKDLRWFIKPVAYLSIVAGPMYKFNAFLAGGAEGIVAKGQDAVGKVVSRKDVGGVEKGPGEIADKMGGKDGAYMNKVPVNGKDMTSVTPTAVVAK